MITLSSSSAAAAAADEGKTGGGGRADDEGARGVTLPGQIVLGKCGFGGGAFITR